MTAGSATGNKHISHIRGAPVTVQMASSGREAGRAMKKDEQSDRGGETKGREERYFSFVRGRLLKEMEERRCQEAGGVGSVGLQGERWRENWEGERGGMSSPLC